MDLNQLLFQHQIALINASEASPGHGRESCFDMAGHYARRIGRLRAEMGAAEYRPLPESILIHGPRA